MRLLKIAAVGAALCWVSAPEIASAGETAATIEQKSKCLIDARTKLKVLTNGIAYWFGQGDPSKPPALTANDLFTVQQDYSIKRNFHVLTDYHSQVFTVLRKRLSDFVLPSDRNALMEQLKSIEQGHFMQDEETSKLYAYNLRFFRMLTGADDFLKEMIEYFGVKQDCLNFPEYEEIRLKAYSTANHAQSELDRVKSYVGLTQRKQRYVEDYVNVVLRNRIQKRYAELTRDDLSSLQDMITVTVLGAQLYDEVTALTSGASASTNAIALSTTVFLKYEESMMLIRIELQRIANYRNRLNALPNLVAIAKNGMTSNLDRYERYLQEKMSIVARGWRTILDDQIYFSTGRQEDQQKYGPACQQQVARHLSCAAAVDGIDAYRNCEKIYEDEVYSCEDKSLMD